MKKANNKKLYVLNFSRMLCTVVYDTSHKQILKGSKTFRANAMTKNNSGLTFRVKDRNLGRE